MNMDLGHAIGMRSNPVKAYVLARETVARLDSFTMRAREGMNLQAAKDFASFVQWSGLADVLEHHKNESGLAVDPELIRTKCRELLSIVHDQFRQNEKVMPIELSQLEQINRNLSLIAGQIAHLAPPRLQTEPQILLAS